MSKDNDQVLWEYMVTGVKPPKPARPFVETITSESELTMEEVGEITLADMVHAPIGTTKLKLTLVRKFKESER